MTTSPPEKSLVRLGVVQMSCGTDWRENAAVAEHLTREAAAEGARVVLLPELFAGPYFCKDKDPEYFSLAAPLEGHPLLKQMASLAAELDIVLPVSFFEREDREGEDPRFFNSMAMYDGGEYLGLYRKSHIPDGPGYWEKYYFAPGDTGFKVWHTRAGIIGVGICWDQWFPEAARCMSLMGAQLLLYPTAIGSEPEDPGLNTHPHWQRVMQGHAGANLSYLAASNRVGAEQGSSCEITFYGGSFIAGPYGEILRQAESSGELVLLADLDLVQVEQLRSSWGLVRRDRRPELYGILTQPDGAQ